MCPPARSHQCWQSGLVKPTRRARVSASRSRTLQGGGRVARRLLSAADGSAAPQLLIHNSISRVPLGADFLPARPSRRSASHWVACCSQSSNAGRSHRGARLQHARREGSQETESARLLGTEQGGFRAGETAARHSAEKRLGNGQPGPVLPGPLLPGNAQLDSGAAPGTPARIPSPNAPWPPLGERYRAKHKKGFGGCWGELWLASDRLVFTCPDNPGKSLSIPTGQIAEVDDDGVLASGEKFHFDIQSLAGKRQVHDLFAEWLARTRLTQQPR